MVSGMCILQIYSGHGYRNDNISTLRPHTPPSGTGAPFRPWPGHHYGSVPSRSPPASRAASAGPQALLTGSLPTTTASSHLCIPLTLQGPRRGLTSEPGMWASGLRIQYLSERCPFSILALPFTGPLGPSQSPHASPRQLPCIIQGPYQLAALSETSLTLPHVPAALALTDLNHSRGKEPGAQCVPSPLSAVPAPDVKAGPESLVTLTKSASREGRSPVTAC